MQYMNEFLTIQADTGKEVNINTVNIFTKAFFVSYINKVVGTNPRIIKAVSGLI